MQAQHSVHDTELRIRIHGLASILQPLPPVTLKKWYQTSIKQSSISRFIPNFCIHRRKRHVHQDYILSQDMASSYHSSYIKHITFQQNHHQQARASATRLPARLSSAPNSPWIKTLTHRLHVKMWHAHLRKAEKDHFTSFPSVLWWWIRYCHQWITQQRKPEALLKLHSPSCTPYLHVSL